MSEIAPAGIAHKSGWKSSEFWGIAAVLVLAVVLVLKHWGGADIAKAMTPLSLASGVYTLARTRIKTLIARGGVELKPVGVLKAFEPVYRAEVGKIMTDVASTVESVVEQPVVNALGKLTAKLDPAVQAELGQAAAHLLRGTALWAAPKLDSWAASLGSWASGLVTKASDPAPATAAPAAPAVTA